MRSDRLQFRSSSVAPSSDRTATPIPQHVRVSIRCSISLEEPQKTWRISCKTSFRKSSEESPISVPSNPDGQSSFTTITNTTICSLTSTISRNEIPKSLERKCTLKIWLSYSKATSWNMAGCLKTRRLQERTKKHKMNTISKNRIKHISRISALT